MNKKLVRKLVRESIKSQLLVEKDLDYLNPVGLFKDRNPKVKAFKNIVFQALQPVYAKDKTAEFLGTMPRQVSRVIKKVYNDPSSELVDRNFLQNDVHKLHYMGIENLDSFLKSAPQKSKNEISAVGYLSGENRHTNPLRASGLSVAVVLDGFVTYAGNKNLSTGMLPSPEELETFKSSGVPKLNYVHPGKSVPHLDNFMGLVMTPLMAMNLTNHINYYLNAVILDRDTFQTVKDRKGPGRWNEFVLDNWSPKGIVIVSRNPEYLDIVNKIGKKYNLPVMTIGDL